MPPTIPIRLEQIRHEVNGLWGGEVRGGEISEDLAKHGPEFAALLNDIEKSCSNAASGDLQPWLTILEQGIQVLSAMTASLDVAVLR